jgi:hypothetical protein
VIDPFSIVSRRQTEGRAFPVAAALTLCDLTGLTKLYEAVLGRDTHDGHTLSDQERYERGMAAIHELIAAAVIARSAILWLEQFTGPTLQRLGWSGQAPALPDQQAEEQLGWDAPLARRLVHGANWGVVRSVASWKLVIEEPPPVDVLIHRAARIVEDFGIFEYGEVSTNPHGTDDQGFGWAGPVHRFDPLMRWVRAHQAAVRFVSFELGIEIPGLDKPLHGGSSLVLAKRDATWELRVSLHTNAYAPVARPGRGDNSAVSAVLAPRLRALLTRGTEAFGRPWQLVDATGYADLVDDGGFLLQATG